jgi:NAD(P)-dependent dehydrogenase (short-subunit alcohol dehydrogenase family)
MKVADNVWYVTGGASGLGEATARRLHELGGYVSIWDISYEKAEKIALDLNDKGSKKRAIAAKVDVVSEEDVVRAIKETDETWPDVPLGGCINAGGVGVIGKIIDAKGTPLDLETFRKVIDVNLVGTFNVSRLTAARLVRDAPKPIPKPNASTQNRGVIINTAR